MSPYLLPPPYDPSSFLHCSLLDPPTTDLSLYPYQPVFSNDPSFYSSLHLYQQIPHPDIYPHPNRQPAYPQSHFNSYYEPTPPQVHYVHPAELSPPPEMAPVNPRFVAGHHPADLRPPEPSPPPPPDMSPPELEADAISPDVDLDADAESDLDAEGEPDLEHLGQGDPDFEYDPDPDEDEDDQADGEYIFRPKNTSAGFIPGEGRILRRRSSTRGSAEPVPSAARYSPYLLSSVAHIAGRPRRAASNPSLAPSSPFVQNGTANEPLVPHTRRRPRASSPLPVPVPVPNLTKKSRGRRVPTLASMQCGGRGGAHRGCHHLSLEQVGICDSKKSGGARIYTCKVNGCGKCFARGEHLKRHVRSIHTYEKPHKCPYPGCGKDFSRHDNLGQHMRVHKDYVATDA